MNVETQQMAEQVVNNFWTFADKHYLFTKIFFIVIAVIILSTIAGILITVLKNLKGKDIKIGEFEISDPKAKTKKLSKSNTPKITINDIKECVKYLEEKKEKLTDDITGIKKRFFEQSKDYAKSRITSAKNNIIETYKTAYLKLYLGNKNVDKESEAVNSTQEINISEKNEEIAEFCSKKCASGLVYFDAKITQDFKPILEEVYRIIENNHLINKGDLEFDEEIRAKADSLTTTLRNKVMSYAKPIDDKLAKIVIDKHINGLQSAIVDSLRNSRILSKKKREVIECEKNKYNENKKEQLNRIFDKIPKETREEIIQSSISNDDRTTKEYGKDM